MCGIVGYLGRQEALPILLDGLKNLEYRGYDSAGLLVFDGKRARVLRAVGKVAALEARVSRRGGGSFRGAVGIAHTRWATHGGVTEANAHPHADCRRQVFVAHNGIIENWKELKQKLVRAGHRFRSETDTEVLAHLVEAERANHQPLAEAARRALGRVKGTYGALFFDTREPRTLVAARNFSPLLIGVGENEFVIASDATAVVKLTNNVIYLKDGEVVSLSPGAHRIFTVGNEAVARFAERIEWDAAPAKKEHFPHFMLKEIYEEPDAVRNSIRGRLLVSEGRAVLGGLREVEHRLRKTERLHISACGSAYLAGKVGEYMLEEYAGLPVEVDFASEFRYRKPVFDSADAFLAISQSGETADTLAGLYEAKEKGILSLGLVNAVGSTAARETDAGIYQHIGSEIGVAATKSFVSQLAILSLLTLFFGRKRGMSVVMGRRIAEELTRIPALMERVLKKADALKRFARKYADAEHFFYVGRKYNFPIAVEGALKLKEIAYVHAEGYGAGEMKHGPIAMIEKRFPSCALAPRDSVYEKMISNIEEIKARGGPVFAIATDGDRGIAKLADDVFYIPKTLEMLTPLLSVVPLHLFAYYVGTARGYDVDKPRNLAKSVTVE